MNGIPYLSTALPEKINWNLVLCIICSSSVLMSFITAKALSMNSVRSSSQGMLSSTDTRISLRGLELRPVKMHFLWPHATGKQVTCKKGTFTAYTYYVHPKNAGCFYLWVGLFTNPNRPIFKGMSLWKYMDIQTTLNFPLRSALESSRRTLKLYLLQPASVLSWKTLDPPDNRLFLLQKVTEERLQWCR